MTARIVPDNSPGWYYAEDEDGNRYHPTPTTHLQAITDALELVKWHPDRTIYDVDGSEIEE